MRIITKIFKVFQFQELPEQIQQTTMLRNRTIHLMGNWWKPFFEDAKSIGVEITSFDRFHNIITGKFLYPVETVIEKIFRRHGELSKTYELAKTYRKDLGDDYFLRKLLDAYFETISRQYDYFVSDDGIKEELQFHEFLENGEIYID